MTFGILLPFGFVGIYMRILYDIQKSWPLVCIPRFISLYIFF